MRLPWVSLGFVNYGESYKGLQFGFANVDNDLKGLQFGFLCYTKNTSAGIQLGFINVIEENKKWFSNFPNELAPFMLFVNWRIQK